MSGERLEIHGQKTHPLNLPAVQICGQLSAVDPGSAHHFEGRIRAAAHADVCAFQQTDAGIENFFRQIAQIRRGIDPGLAGLIEPVCALPALHLDDVQLGVQVIFAVEHFRQFAHRHRHGEWAWESSR